MEAQKFSLCPYNPAIHAHLNSSSSQTLPSVNSDKASELYKVLQESPYPGIAKVRFNHEGGKIVNVIQDPKIAAIFAHYFRQDPGNEDHPFQANQDSIRQFLLGNDSLMSCTAAESVELRSILLNFLKTISNEQMIDLCQSALWDFTSSWRKDDEATINLQAEIPKLIAKIGIKGIMGFPDHLLDSMANEMAIIAKGKVESTSWFGSVVSTVKNMINFGRKGFAVLKIRKMIRNEIVRQLETGSTHGLLTALADYAKQKHHNQTDLFTKQDIDLIVHNYTVILFAFQETTASLVKHMIWQLALDPEAQEKLREDGVEAQKLYYQALSQKSQGVKQAYAPYIEKMGELKPLIQELLRLYSPGGFNRTFNQPMVLDNGVDQHLMHEGEMIDYSPFFAGRSEVWFQSPQTFDPSRFTGPTTDEALKRNQEMLHFGGGAHVCPGQKLAMVEMRVISSFMLNFFRFTTDMKQVHFIMGATFSTQEELIVKAKPIGIIKHC